MILISLTYVGSDNGNDTTVPVLLLLYEFETKARLGNADLDKILDRAVALPYADAKVFEIMAGTTIQILLNICSPFSNTCYCYGRPIVNSSYEY